MRQRPANWDGVSGTHASYRQAKGASTWRSSTGTYHLRVNRPALARFSTRGDGADMKGAPGDGKGEMRGSLRYALRASVEMTAV